MLQSLLRWLTPYSAATSYTVSTSVDYTVPVCPTVQSYICLYWLHLQSFIQDIYACISISVMHCMAVRTLPYTNSQIFHHRIFIPTTRTGLTTWIHGWYFYNTISIPDRLICEHIKKLTPRCRTDVLCQFMITHHISYLQFLYADCLVFTNQLGGLFLQEIISLIYNYIFYISPFAPLSNPNGISDDFFRPSRKDSNLRSVSAQWFSRPP